MAHMAKSEKRIEATALRRKGFPIREIAKKLGVSKGSASIWCRDVVLTPSQIALINKNLSIKTAPGRLIGAMMNKKKRIDALSKYRLEGIKEIGEVSSRELLLIGTALYWAEGAKTIGKFIFANSNASMILLMYKFLIHTLHIPKSEIRIGIQINSIHQYRIEKVLLFWSKLLDLPTSQFDNPYYVKIKPKKVYENMDDYHGLVRLRVIKGSSLQYRLLGLIDGITHQVKDKIE